MILREPISIVLGIMLGLFAISTHVDKVETKKKHALKVHYLKMHPNAYNNEINVRLRHRKEIRDATKYRVHEF